MSWSKMKIGRRKAEMGGIGTSHCVRRSINLLGKRERVEKNAQKSEWAGHKPYRGLILMTMRSVACGGLREDAKASGGSRSR